MFNGLRLASPKWFNKIIRRFQRRHIIMFFPNKKKEIKNLFICKKRIDSYGVSYGLMNSASFVANALNDNKIESKVVFVADGNCIDREVYNYNPTHVFIEAIWVTSEKMEVLLKKYPKIKWVIRIHSQFPFLANEGIALDWIWKYDGLSRVYKNLALSGNNINFNNDIQKLYINSTYLPNIYCPNFKLTDNSDDKIDEYIDIGCFGAVRPMKNHLLQAVAAIHFADKIGKKLRFHINGDRTEQKGDQALRNLESLFNGYKKHQLVKHGWMTHLDFIGVVRKMDIGMQVSFSESFNIVSADFAENYVPIVVSGEIDWLPSWCKAKTTSTESIVRKLYLNYYLDKFFNISSISKFFLKRYNKKALNVWLKYFNI
jgi:hypothetical protein